MDFLGFVRVRVDRSKPLSESPEVWLDREYSGDGWPDDAIGALYLHGSSFGLYLHGSSFGITTMPSLPVKDCIVG